MGQDHRKGRARRFFRSAAGSMAMMAALNFSIVGVARADVASEMNNFFSDAGGAANVTGPSAYQGQSAGYYSLGNVWTRFPQKSVQPFNLQLPSARAGCGGIDLFSGSFSFINASEIVAMLKATANNALGFAFKLAIDFVSPEIGKVMDEFSQKAQLLNQMNISSCETAQALVGGIGPRWIRPGRPFARRSATARASFPTGPPRVRAATTAIGGIRQSPGTPMRR